nr:hypothetical protein [Tanacetum cinerariifolium]
MSDSDESGVTYTDVSSPFEESPDIGSPIADDHEHLELPEVLEDPYVEVTLQAPPFPDYIPGPEDPEQAPPSPDYVPGPEHANDEIVAEDQPYAEDASPTAQSPKYVPESDLEVHPEDDDDEDPEEDLVDYPVDGGDDGDDEEGSSEDDQDDDMDIESNEEEEEEEHPAPADSVVVALIVADQAPSAKETEPFESDESTAIPPPHPAYRMTARISIPAPVPMPACSDSEVVRLLAMSSPPSLPLSPWSSPPPQIPFPPLPPILSPPSPVSDAPSSGIPLLLAISAPTSSPPLQLPSASRREDRPEVTLPPQKRLGIALGPGYEVGESSSTAAARPAGEIRRDPEREAGYGITDSWDKIVETLQGAPVSTDTKLGGYMREFETRVRRDKDEIYMRLDDEQKARLSREASVRSTDASDLVRGEVMSLRTTVLGQMTEIRELHAVDRRRQIVISEMLRADHRRSTEIIGLRTALQGQHVMLSEVQMAMIAIILERVLEGQNELLVNVLTPTFSSVNHYISKAMKELPVFPNGLKEWSLSFISTVGHDAAYGMPWKTLMKMMTDKYCPRNEIKKLEMEIWDLKVKGLPDMIHGSVVASKPKTMQEAVKITTKLMDKKIRTFAERETASKRKFENTSRNTQNQQQQSNKRQNTGRVYTATSGEKKQYGGSKPLCAKCNYHHDSPCAPKCHNCNKVGHFARDCRNTENTNNANNQRGTGLGQKPTCYECGVQGHFKRECPKLKNKNNHGNQGGRNNAPARVYAVGYVGTDPDANVVMDTFLLNNRYAFVLFDTGANKSFVSTAFNTQINITSSTLNHCYDVELADGRIIRLNTILRGCTLNLLNHPFNINLMPLELERTEHETTPIVELLSDYDCDIRYHQRKANVVADALSRKEREPPLRVRAL